MAATQVEIGQKLIFMDRQNLFDRFDFNKNFFFHDEVGPVTTLETNAFIYSGQYDLSFKPQTGARKLECQTILIKLLKKPRPERLMNLNRHSNHTTGQFPGHQPEFLFSALSGISAPSECHGTHPQHERPHHPPKA
jgi:hypothetical protein